MLIKTSMQICGVTLWLETPDDNRHPQENCEIVKHHIRAAFRDYADKYVLTEFAPEPREIKIDLRGAAPYTKEQTEALVAKICHRTPVREPCAPGVHVYSDRRKVGEWTKYYCVICGAEKPCTHVYNVQVFGSGVTSGKLIGHECTNCGHYKAAECEHDFSARSRGGHITTDCVKCGVPKPA